MSESAGPKEAKTTPPQLGSSKELASTLGFKLDEKTSTKRLKVYTKPFKGSVGEGSVVLSFDTVYAIPPGEEKPYQRERIGFSVRLGEGLAWKKELLAQDMREITDGLEIRKDEMGAFEKSSLRENGYQKLYDFLNRELETGGRLHETSESFMTEMVEEQSEGTRFIDNRLIPEVQKRFLSFPNMLNAYKENKEIYFWGDEEKGKKTVSVIRFFVRPYQIGPSSPMTVLIDTGRSKIVDGQIDEDYFYTYGKPQTIAPPEEMRDLDHPRASWTFDEFDLALNQLNRHLESKQSK